MAHQPLEANFFPGILERLVGRLGLVPPGESNPPTSVREGVACHFAATLREAIRRTGGGDMDIGQVTSTMAPHGLHLDYDPDFHTRRVNDIAPTFTSPLLPGLIDNILQLERPEIPGGPASFKADGNPWGSGRAPPEPEVSCPFCAKGSASKKPASKGEAPEKEPPSQGENPWGQTPLKPEPEDIPTIVISEDYIPNQEPSSSSTPRSAQILNRK